MTDKVNPKTVNCMISTDTDVSKMHNNRIMLFFLKRVNYGNCITVV